MATITITVDDATLDELAELVVAKLLDHAPGLVDAPFEGDGAPTLGQAAGAKRERTPAQKAAAERMVAANKAKRSPRSTSDGGSRSSAGGFAGAVIDPRTHRMVEPDETTNHPEPADPAPEPS